MIVAGAVMALAVCFTGLASEYTENFEMAGFNFPYTEEIESREGLFIPQPLGAIDDDHHVYAILFFYEGMPAEDALKILYSDNPSEEERQAFYDVQGIVSVLLASDADFETVKTEYDNSLGKSFPVDFDRAEEVGSADGYAFYSVPAENSEEFFSAIGEKYTGEFQKLEQAVLEALHEAEYYEPVDPLKGMYGQTLAFTTTDLDGNTVTSEELFAGNEITMINCWGLWCPNCVNEMAELAQIHTRLQEKGCGIVGMEWERTQDESAYQIAREKMEEWGTNYPNVLMPDELLRKVDAFPTTFFADREGKIVAMPIVGAAVSLYESTVYRLLGEEKPVGELPAEVVEETTAGTAAEAGEEASADTAAEAGEETSADTGAKGEEETVDGTAAEPEEATAAMTEADTADTAVYRVNIADEEGPIEEVMVQFCDETTCRIGKTDGNGAAVFEVPAGVEYEVHVMKVPEGYKEDETVYHTAEGSREVNILLEKED